MKKWYIFTLAICLISLILATSSYVDGDTDDNNDAFDVEIHISTFLDNIGRVDILVDSQKYEVDLVSIDSFYKTGTVTVNVTVGSSIEIKENEAYNGTKWEVESEESRVYLWITNYQISEDKLVCDGAEVSIVDNIANVSGQFKNLALTNSIIIGTDEFVIKSAIIGGSGNGYLAFANINVNTSSSFYYTISGVVVQNSQLGENAFAESKAGIIAGSNTLILTIFDSHVSAGAFNRINCNSVSLIINVGGDNVFEKCMCPGEFTNSYGMTFPRNYSIRIHIESDNYDFRGLLESFDKSSGSISITSIDFKSTSVIDYKDSFEYNVGSISLTGASVVGSHAFDGLSVNYVILMKSTKVVEVGDYAFYDIGTFFDFDLSHATHIGNSAFENSGIKEVNLNAVVTIGYNAFKNCTDLSSITIGNEFKGDLDGIFDYAGSSKTQDDLILSIPEQFNDYSWCPGVFGKSRVVTADDVSYSVIVYGDKAAIRSIATTNSRLSLSTIIINEKTYVIDQILPHVLGTNTSVIEIVFGDSILIQDYAFESKSNLSKVSFGDDIRIGDNAFVRTGLTSIDLSSCSVLGVYAFQDSKISHIKGWNNEITAIPEGLFKGCNISVSDIKVMEFTNVGKDAFDRSSFALDKLTVLSVESNGLGYVEVSNLILGDKINDIHIDNVKINGTVSLMGNIVPEEYFKDQSGLEKVEIKIDDINGMNIKKYAFSGCSNLTTIVGWDKVRSIQGYAFENCKKISGTIDLSSITSVGECAFTGCTRITEVKLPETVRTLNSSAFDDWSVVRGGGIDVIGSGDQIYILRQNGSELFSASKGIVGICIPCNVTSIATNAFYNCTKLEKVEFESESKLEKIGDYAFLGCISLKDITLPNTVSNIGTGAFTNCKSLESITIPGSVTKINTGVFNGASNLSSVTLPVGLKSIGQNSFRGTSLTEIDLSKTKVNTISQGAFSNCTQLSHVILPKTITRIGFGTDNTGVFDGCTSLNWIEFGDEKSEVGALVIPSYITWIHPSAFRGTAISFVSSESKNLTISENAFYGIDSLATVNLKATGTIKINSNAFAYCKNLQSIDLHGSSVEIGIKAFLYCSSLGTDPNGNQAVLDLSDVKTVYSNAFGNCISISEVKFSSKLSDIDPTSFAGCVELKQIGINGSNSNYSISGSGILIDKKGMMVLAPTGLDSIVIPSDVKDISTISINGKIQSVLYLLTNLESISVDESSSLYEIISGCLVKDGMVVAVPSNIRTLDVDAGDQDLNFGYVFGGTRIQDLNIKARNITFTSSAFSDSNLRNVMIDSSGTTEINAVVNGIIKFVLNAKGNLTVANSISADSIRLTSDEDITVNNGTLKAESVCVIAKNIKVRSGLFNGSVGMNELILDAENKIDGGDVLISDDCMSSGTISLGFAECIGLIDAPDGVDCYYNMNRAGIIDGWLKYVIIEGKVIRQLDASVSIFVVSDLDGLTLSKNDDGRWSFETNDGHQYYDVKAESYIGGVWEILPYFDGYVFGENAIVRISALDSDFDDTYVRVVFDTRTTVSVSDVMVVEGRSILNSQLPLPVRAGYKFEGWYVNSSLNDDSKYNHGAITESLTLYAKWESLGGYVDLIDIGGSFSREGGTFSEGSFNDITFTVNPGFIFLGFNLSPTDMVEWEEDGNIITILNVAGFVSVRPVVKYSSSSSDLTSIIGISTVSSDEDLLFSWAYSNNPVMSGMSWKNTPGTPLIVDGYVYLHLGDSIYKLDVETGKEVAKAASRDTGTFYNYVGFGGNGDSWYLVDYATGKILDEDLSPILIDGKEVRLPSGMNYVKWHDGYFYTSFEGKMWKLTPDKVDDSGTMVNQYPASIAGTGVPEIFSQYGTTSSALIVDDVMYWLSTSNKDRMICSAKLDDGTVQTVTLDGLKGYFMDDGWLTYYDGRIYTTGYTKGLFGDTGADGNSKIVYLDVDEGSFGTVNYIEVIGNRNSLLSNFVIVDGRGYLNATISKDSGAYLMVYDIGADGKPVYAGEVKSDPSHGGIVASTANLTEGGGYVNIYMMNYSGSNYLYVFTDRHNSDGTWTLDENVAIKELNPGFGSQAIRVDSEGRIIFYNDSGALYCYVPASMYRDYYFLIEGTNDFEVVSGKGEADDPYDALADALFNSKGFKTKVDVSDDGTVVVTFGKNKLYAYYCDVDNQGNKMFKSISECPKLSTLRFIYLLAEDSARDVDPDREIYISEDGRSGIQSDEVPITAGGVETSSIVLKVGESIKLDSTAMNVRWSTDDSSVIRIDSEGNVAAVSLGYASIVAETIRDGASYRSTCRVSVIGTTLADTSDVLKNYVGSGMTKTIRYTVSFNAEGGIGEIPDPQSFEAGSTIELPATLTRSGYVFKGWSDGDAMYIAESSFIVSRTVTLNAVWDKEVGSISIDSGSGTMKEGGITALRVKVAPSDAVYDGEFVWKSSNPSVARVSANGIVTAVSAGKAVITVSTIDGKYSASCVITVEGTPTSVSLDRDTLRLEAGESATLRASASPGPASGFEWATSDPSVATVNGGVITGIAPGTAVITVKHGDLIATCIVTVYKNGDVKTDVVVDEKTGDTVTRTEETEVSGSSTIIKNKEETVDKDGNLKGTTISIDAETDDGNVKTEAKVKLDSDGNVIESVIDVSVSAEVSSSNGKQTISVSRDDLLAAMDQIEAVRSTVGQDVEPAITIDVGTKGSASSSIATLPSDVLDILSEDDDAMLELKTSAGTIGLTSDVMSKLSTDGEDVRLGISRIPQGDIPQETKDRIGNAHLFELSAVTGTTEHHLLGGKVFITLPYALERGADAGDVRVYHMDDSGALVPMDCTYDPETGEVSFVTDHFSCFVVSGKALTDESGSSDQSDDGLPAIAIAAAAALVVVIAAAIVLFRRSGRL